MGEAYCSDLMGRRLSIWEAQAENRNEAEQERSAAAVSKAARQRIQQAAQTSRAKRSRETRHKERERQLDRQRADIHPPHVLERLAALEPPPPDRIRVARAEPDPEWEGPVQRLAIRERGKETR